MKTNKRQISEAIMRIRIYQTKELEENLFLYQPNENLKKDLEAKH